MDAKRKLDKIVASTLGLMTYVMQGMKKPYEKQAGIARDDKHKENPLGETSEMVRVTDSVGEEFLCPVSATIDRNFVGESNKRSCFDYNTISKQAPD